MAVQLNTDRRGVEIKWDAAAVGAPDEEVEIRSVNSADPSGKASTRKVKNDGLGTVTYPGDYTGSSDITVTGSKGSDTGTITV